jgi:vanillate O-demethylase ferredoxin subunit
METGQPHDDAKSYLFLDSATGQRLSLTHYADLPLGRRIYVTMVMMHSGQIWGLPYEILLLAACLGIGYLAYSGPVSWWRRRARRAAAFTLSLVVTRKHVEAEDICVFELADPKNRALPSFSAGSHVDVHIRPGLTRQYSLCNDPRETHRYMLAVMREPHSRGGSRAMHDEMAEGDVIAVGQPKNHFPLAHGATRSLLFAGGIGITPILCMAERLANSGAEFEMHYCTRSAARTAFRQRILASPFARRVRFHLDDGPPEQKLDLAAVLAGPRAGTHLYVCGPKGFMEAVIAAARRAGWAEEAIHREYFAAGADSGAEKHPFDLKIASSGRIVHVPAEKSALEALLDHGFEMESSCREGVCGTCVIRVLDGEPDHRDLYLTAEEREKNDAFLPCCSRARSEALVIDL